VQPITETCSAPEISPRQRRCSCSPARRTRGRTFAPYEDLRRCDTARTTLKASMTFRAEATLPRRIFFLSVAASLWRSLSRLSSWSTETASTAGSTGLWASRGVVPQITDADRSAPTSLGANQSWPSFAEKGTVNGHGGGVGQFGGWFTTTCPSCAQEPGKTELLTNGLQTSDD
jgi:hypothetical protein